MTTETCSFSLATDTTVLSITLCDEGFSVVPDTTRPRPDTGTHGAAAPAPCWGLPRPVDTDATPTWSWRQMPDSDATGVRELCFVFEEPGGLQVESIWSAYPGVGPIRLTMTLRNTGDAARRIRGSTLLALRRHTPAKGVLRHFWVEKGSGRPSDAGVHDEPIRPGYAVTGLSSTFAGSGEDAVAWQIVHDPIAATGLYTGIESSGCVTQTVQRNADAIVQLVLAVDETRDPFEAVLEPGEVYPLPPVLLGAFAGTVDDACNELHTWLDRHRLPPVPGGTAPLLMNNTWGVGFDIDEATVRRMLDRCADLGVEAFDVDAGWYEHVGCWHEHPDRFPGGIAALVDYAHARGLRLGVWVAWAQAGDTATTPETLCAHDTTRRAWLPQEIPADWTEPWPWVGTPICLAAPGAAEWCRADMRRLLRHTRVDLLKHDQITVLEACRWPDHGHTSSSGDVSLRTAAAYERVQDALRRECPNVVFENCLGAGRTMDFAVMQRTHYALSTDSYEPLAIRRAFHDLSHPFPPRVLGLYITHKPDICLDEFRYRLRSAMLGWCLVMQDMDLWSSEEQDAARDLFAVYKERLRPLIAHGSLYHVGTRPTPDGWDAFEYWDRTTEQGVVAVFRADSPQPRTNIVFKGLEPAARYQLTCHDESAPTVELNGATLMTKGLPCSLPHPLSSEWIFVERAPMLHFPR